MNDVFKDYGVAERSIQMMIEDLAVGFLINGMKPPKKIVLDKHAYNRFGQELQEAMVGDRRVGSLKEVDEIDRAVKKKMTEFNTSGGLIEIVCED